MIEEMTLEQLQAEHKRALQLEAICRAHGYVQAATVHEHTARSLTTEIMARSNAA